MVACLSSTLPDSLIISSRRRNPFLKSHYHTRSTCWPKFGSAEALLLLQNCTNFNHLRLVHGKIIRNALSSNQLLVRKLIHLCSSYGRLDYAALLFDQVQEPHTFTWNFMIRTYTVHGYSLKALLFYNLMIRRGFPPDKFTFPFVGKRFMALLLKLGFQRICFFCNTLMDLYFSCGDAGYGRKVFEKMRVRNVVSSTTYIAGLAVCGDLDAARRAFDQMPTRNVVSWTAMIHAFELFWRMLLANSKPNEFTLVNLLKACSELGSLKLGRWIHDYAVKNGFELGAFLGTALIDMYSKCGSFDNARQVFREMEIKSLATWNTMITSLGVHGYGEEALSLFAKMEEANIRPDAITFVGVLCACLQTAKVREGDMYFKYMREHYGITPAVEHYTCMIELYCRANLLDELDELVKVMPGELSDDISAWIKSRFIDDIVETENSLEHHGEELHYWETQT
ncbi:pentatricopeptide repeat-containing protein [Salix suchowensis]|nr:pentatricopeptide repeat-containing protein [Salix suchowensis]